MSITPTTAGGLPAIPDDDTGLEDFDTSDFVMPRLTIDHKEAKFIDNLSGQSFDTLNVVLLGLVKQRILWDDEVNEGDKPLCKSNNFTNGNPDDLRFPWQTSGFDKADVPESPDGIVLPCASCNLKEWGTNPRGSTPWCSEQHTFPLLMEVDGGLSPALFTVQRTGIKPSKTYITAFARSKTPLYTCFTRLSLQPMRKGSVHYAVPLFVRGAETEAAEFPYYAQQYRSIREFISAAPKPQEDAPATTTAAPAAAPVSAPASAPAAASAPSPMASPDDDDLPF